MILPINIFLPSVILDSIGIGVCILAILSITSICSLYSNTIQALYRFFRIIYYTHPILHRNIYYYIFCIFFQIFLSALQALPILLFGEFQYDDYHCQVLLTSWRGVILAIILIWLFPVSSTFTIYMRTMRYVLLNSANFTFRQKTRIERDFTVIKRVVWLLSFIILCGIPSICLSLIYFIFGYISWWETYLCWLTFLLSFMGMIVVHIYYAPHLRNLWRKRRNNVNPTLMRLTTYR
ncbi:hypothetical protein I4U23_020024 [Adineta vaga]|nr:hypothetical protein I4U23_020024 [Adineta vaga]